MNTHKVHKYMFRFGDKGITMATEAGWAEHRQAPKNHPYSATNTQTHPHKHTHMHTHIHTHTMPA